MEISHGSSEKLSEFCGPEGLEGHITLGVVWSPLSCLTYVTNGFPLGAVSPSVLQNLAEVTCEFYPAIVPLPLVGCATFRD